MKKKLLFIIILFFAVSCEKGKELGSQSDGIKVADTYAANIGSNSIPSQICDEISINPTTQSLTIKDVSYYYPTNLIDLTKLSKDKNGSYVITSNCIDMSAASEAQKALHTKNDSLMNVAQNAFRALGLNKPKLPIAPYTMQDFYLAMDTAPWPDGSDGAAYVSTIFNTAICKNPEIPKLPGISAFLLLPALIQNKNFTEITLTEAINYTNKADGFVIAIMIHPENVELINTTVIDHRYFKKDCECEDIESVIVREGPGQELGRVRLSSFFDYNLRNNIRYFYYNGV